MGIIKRQSLKTSIVNYIGVVIGVIFFNFVFPHILSEEYLGLIGLLQNLMFVLVSIPSLGLGHVLLRYYSIWKDTPQVEAFHAFAIQVMLLSISVFGIFYWLFHQPITAYYQQQSPLFVPYYYLVIPLVAIFAFIQYFEIYSMLKLRVAVPAFLREIVVRILLILLVFLFVKKYLSESYFVWGIVAVYLLSFIILLTYVLRILQFKAYGASLITRHSKQYKEAFQYGGGMLLLMIATNVHNFLDGIILPAYLGLGALGIYIRPLVLGQMIQVPYRAISMISIPIIREAIVDNNLKKVYELNKQLSINLYLIGTFLFTLLISNADAIFSLLPPQYAVAKNVLYIIALGRLIDMAFGLNSEILNYSKHYKYIIILSVFMMLMTIALNMLLIPRLGMSGAAIAVSASLVIFNILKTLVIYSKYHFHCFSKHYITLSLITLFVLGIMQLIPYIKFLSHHMFMNACINILFKCALSSILFLLPTYWFRVSYDLNHFVKLILTGQIIKGGHKMENL